MSIANPTILIGGPGVTPVPAVELLDGFAKGIGPGGPWVRKKYLLAWADSDAAANAIMGLSRVVGGIAGTIYRRGPQPCPESPNLLALSVDVQPSGQPQIPAAGSGVAPGRVNYDFATVAVEYGVWPYNFPDEAAQADPYNYMTPDQQAYPFCTFDVDYATEHVTVPNSQLLFVSDDAAVGSEVNIRVGCQTISATMNQVPYLPVQKLASLAGCVNNATFMGFPAETVLFDDAKTRRTLSTDGGLTQEVTMIFRYRAKNWNFVARNAYTWERATADGTSTGTGLYTKSDLRPLFFGLSLN